jgi:hypothetical protein
MGEISPKKFPTFVDKKEGIKFVEKEVGWTQH